MPQSWHAWERRSLIILRQAELGTMRITLEVPIEDGELFANAVDRAVEAGKGNLGPEFDTSGWHAEQADAVIELARSYLDGGAIQGAGDEAKRPAPAADHYQVVVHVDESALIGATSDEASAESLRGGISRHDGAPRSDLPIETIQHRLLHEGRFRIRRDIHGALYFERHDGRVIPKAGYEVSERRGVYLIGPAASPRAWPPSHTASARCTGDRRPS